MPFRLLPSLLPACVLAAAVAGLGIAGCSTTFPLASGPDAYASPPAGPTGSVRPAEATTRHAEEPAAADLTLIRSAAVELMTRGAKDTSRSWENPRTGARGTVTPITSAYALSGATCREFMASFVRGPQQTWYQGSACRSATAARWEVRDMRPLKRS